MMDPRRGEVWLLDMEPTLGAEMGKTRPVLVISRDALARLPLRIIVPITTWKDHFADLPWFVRIEPSPRNGLERLSGVDTFQVRAVDIRRFRKRLGVVEPEYMHQVEYGLCLVLHIDCARREP